MEAKELRIGNWVTTRDGLTQVEDVLTFGINMQHDCWLYDIIEVTPIPLTEEILLKCGLTNDYGGELRWVTLNGDATICIGKDNIVCLSVGGGHDYGHEEMQHIKYLHQLQNLVHALTGEELNVEL